MDKKILEKFVTDVENILGSEKIELITHYGDVKEFVEQPKEPCYCYECEYRPACNVCPLEQPKVKPVEHGQGEYYTCSECDTIISGMDLNYKHKYCPECGPIDWDGVE